MARMSTVLGPDGRPIDKTALYGPQKAAPTLAGVRSPITGHPADGLTPARLARIMRAADEGDPIAYLELSEDMEERDLHYRAVLSTRRRQVSQIPITVEAASDEPAHIEHADLIREWIADGVLEGALFDLFDAIGKGLSILEIEWSSTPRRVEPKALHWRPQQWFGYEAPDYDTPLLIEPHGREPLAPHRFIVHRHKSKSGLAMRGGLARPAAWAWMYKAFTQRDWAIFVQNYGQPIRLGKYDRASSPSEQDVLWRAVANIAGDCAAIIPADMQIEFVEVKDVGAGSELYEKRAEWCDRQVSKLVLGQTTTTDAISGGHAVAQEHRLVQEDIERSDAREASSTLTMQLVPWMVSLNYGPQDRYPRIVIGRPDELPISVVVDALYKLGSMGLTVEASQVRDRLGFTEPEKGAGVELIGGRPPPAAVAALPSPGAAPGDPPPEGLAPAADLNGRGGGFTLLRHLVERHAAAPPSDHVAVLVERMSEEAAGAVAGLADEVRAAFEAATDLTDLMARLDGLQLDPDAFAQAMARGMALAHLAGQAALLEEIGSRVFPTSAVEGADPGTPGSGRGRG